MLMMPLTRTLRSTIIRTRIWLSALSLYFGDGFTNGGLDVLGIDPQVSLLDFIDDSKKRLSRDKLLDVLADFLVTTWFQPVFFHKLTYRTYCRWRNDR